MELPKVVRPTRADLTSAIRPREDGCMAVPGETFDDEEIERLRAETPGCLTRIHLNNAGASLMPQPVVSAAVEHLRLEAEIGGYEAADARAEQIEAFYAAAAALLNCRPDNVAYMANATDAYVRALSAIPFERGDVVVTTTDDYISNQIMFMSLKKRLGIEVVHALDQPWGGVDIDALRRLLETRRPRLVAVTHIPTNSGLVQPVEAIGAICRELELLYLVDACQSVGQRVVDVETMGCDFLSATSRKFLRGPRGSGFLYVSDAALASGLEPLYLDMRGAEWSAKDEYSPVPGARRYEDWEFAYALLLASAAAVRYAVDVGIERTQHRVMDLAARLRQALLHDGLRVLDRGDELAGLVTVEIAGWEAEAFKRELDSAGVNFSLGFREYARLDFDAKDVDWCVRLSPHYYNTADEVDAVAAIVTSLADRA
jgi:selenocysteine lyase/cysteine desulfurase